MRPLRRFVGTVLFSLLLLIGCNLGLSETEEKNITSHCSITVSSNKDHAKRMTGGDYSSFWQGKKGSTITVKVKGDEKAQGICVYFHGNPAALTAKDADGNVIGSCDALFENTYIAFDHAVKTFTLCSADDSALEISRLKVVKDGELPSWVQTWDVLEGKADMMLVSTHPDDELLWFGGMLPTYAGEQGKKVIVVYMAGGNSPKRKNELLDGLWTCGVQYYPEIGYFPDKGASSHESVIRNWGEGNAEKRIVEMLRKYRPDVVVTQDIHGEYGHYHHIVTVEAVIRAVTELTADEAYDPETIDLFGTWTPLKLYLHLYSKNQIIFDWRQPLDYFGGKTSLQVAREAFKKHISQQKGRYAVNDSGKLNCSIFGLYYSTVGEDKIHQSLFENVD